MKIILLLKLIFFFTISMGAFYVLDYGFVFDSSDKLLKPFLLSILTITMIFKPNLKRYILLLSGVCLVLMIFLNLLGFSNAVGDFGFSLLVVTIFLYLPQIIKKGHVEKI